jgi:hypothetical protein
VLGLGGPRPVVAFARAVSDAPPVAITLLGVAWLAVCWLPRHARGGH